MNTRKIGTIAVLLALIAPLPAAAQRTESRLLATTAGTVLGVGAGGYITVATIVAESRMGRYVHDIEDILGWRSMPVLTGAAIGASLGFYSPRRLEASAVYGAAGLGVGALVGMGIGSLIWEPPEGRWAGAAIGAGVGMLVGNALGVLYPYRTDPDELDITGRNVEAVGVPIILRITF